MDVEPSKTSKLFDTDEEPPKKKFKPASPPPDDDEMDSLEAFMQTINPEAQSLKEKALAKAKLEASKRGDVILQEIPEEKKRQQVAQQEEKKKPVGKVIEAIDHRSVEYAPFRKDFYIEVPDIKKMTEADVRAYRKEMDDIKIRGKGCPNPVKTFAQCGLRTKIMSVLEKNNFAKPTPIQAQAIPAIMSGKDVIGIAKTGSGKTLAFLLPMYRHILDQPPLSSTDGPIALIMVPTRELALQIHLDCKKFKTATGVRSVCVYGGAGVKHQIGDLKRGAEIIVCTPGRMIDVLCANKGRVTNLQRVTYLVLDEADRMFDMGFEPQIAKIIQNIRPDRQTVLFSATFPRSVEAVARKILKNPVEISIRGKGVVTDTVDQKAMVISASDKLSKLLELVGEWYDQGSILVFVDRQEATDHIWSSLVKSGYQSAGSLHGAKDQMDRDAVLKEFKSGATKILVATSIAARGLDVPSIRLVVNYDMPNHLEDYVHRVGRTGRAGQRGTAWTFITPDESEYSRDLVKAMQSTNQPIPDDVQAMFNEFELRRKSGEAKKRKSGFHTGSGFQFDEAEAKAKDAILKIQKMAYGIVPDEEEKGEDEDEEEPRALLPVLQTENQKMVSRVSSVTTGSSVANAFVQELMLQQSMSNATRCSEELEINDYPQQARWKVTHKDALANLNELTGCGCTTKGQYYPPGRTPPVGHRKLYLFIEGNSPEEVRNAKIEVKRILDEAVANARPETTPQYGKYTV